MRCSMCIRVRVNVWKSLHHLKSMGGFRLVLKILKRRAEAGIAVFRLCQKPGFAVPNHQEIHLPLLFVAEITQLKFTEAQICPSLYRFEEVAGHKGFKPFSGIGNG